MIAESQLQCSKGLVHMIQNFRHSNLQDIQEDEATVGSNTWPYTHKADSHGRFYSV